MNEKKTILMPLSQKQVMIMMLVETLNERTKLNMQRKIYEGRAALDNNIQQMLVMCKRELRVKDMLIDHLKGKLENPDKEDNLNEVPLAEFLQKVQTE